MATKAHKSKARSKKRETASYIFRIEDWAADYDFGASFDPHAEGPYWEHIGLSLTGTFSLPDQLKDRRATLELRGDRRDTRALMDPASGNWKATYVGTLIVRGAVTDLRASLPYDAMWGLMGAFSTGAIQVMAMHGQALYRGEAKIETLSFARNFDPEEL